jgi:uncharacterized protein YbjT (DUF2867 family)
VKIVVIGGTGLIGSKVVEKLRQRGHDAVAAAPDTGVDTILPPVRFQPIASQDVASAIADAALGEPVNGTIEIAGRDAFTLDEAVREVLEQDGDSRKVIADSRRPITASGSATRRWCRAPARGSDRRGSTGG